MITEAGAAQGSDKASRVAAMLTGLATDPRGVGLVYFDYGLAQSKRADWTLENDQASLAACRETTRSLTPDVVGPAVDTTAAEG